MVTTVGGKSTGRSYIENKLKMCVIFLFYQSLAMLGCVTFSVYVSEQMGDFTTETKFLFKYDIGSCTEAKFIVPDWGIKSNQCQTTVFSRSKAFVFLLSLKKITVKVNLIPPIKDYEFGLFVYCVVC
jgi:hypothetical protein